MKLLKILSINFIIILILLFLLDICIYYRHLYMSHKYNPLYDNISYFKHISRDLSYKNIEKKMFSDEMYPKAENTELKNSSPYILFGCSFTEGAALSEKDKYTYQLAKKVHSPVYNRASGGWGTQHMLFQLKSDKFYKIIQPDFDKYVLYNKDKSSYKPVFIYTYISDHINRIHVGMEPVLFGGYPTFVYRIKNNNFEFDKTSQILFRFPLSAKLKEAFYNLKKPADKIENLKLHILESKKEIDKHYKNSEFIVLIYIENVEILYLVDELLKNGIKVVFFEGLTGKNPKDINYVISETDSHPNAKAWTLLVPKLVNYIENADEKEIYKQAYFKHELLKNYNPEYKQGFKDFMNSLREKYIEPSGFSLLYQDRNIIKQYNISRFRVSLAYINWCISNLILNTYFKTAGLFFLNNAIKLNPYNNSYQIYKERYYK